MNEDAPMFGGRDEVRVKFFAFRDPADLPAYATPGAAGMDLRASIDTPITLQSAQRLAIPTGIAIALPAGYEAQVRPRSGLAKKHGIGMVNAPGTIDCDFRGEIGVLLINLSDTPYTIQPRERIAQLVIAPVARVKSEVVVTIEELGETERGAAGFGSTGV